jgi:hypothetical protein
MVYRPPKKKSTDPRVDRFPANRPDADPLEGPLQGAGQPVDPRSGDDRNLVLVDRDFSDADFEDRVWLFWEQRKGLIFGLIGLACVGVIGWQGWKFVQQQQQASINEAYRAAKTPEELQAFSKAHADSPLGKLAILEAADALYQKSQYKEAASAYASAATVWGTDPNGQRARVGSAMATVLSGDVAGGTKLLGAIAVDPGVLDTFRGECYFHLVSIALQAGDVATAKTYADRAKALQAPDWSRQALGLIDLVPTLGATPPSTLLANPSPAAASSLPKVPAATPVMMSGPPAPSAPSAPATTAPAPAAPAQSAASDATPLKLPEVSPLAPAPTTP